MNDTPAILKTLKLQKSKLGVGKALGKNIWLHLSTLSKLELPFVNEIMSQMDSGFCVVRINKDSTDFQISNCPKFDEEREPKILGQRNYVIIDGKASLQKESIYRGDNPLIFHHKHLFVNNDYLGFDVEESVKWSLVWKTKIGSCRKTSSSIGRIKQWNAILSTLNLPLSM